MTDRQLPIDADLIAARRAQVERRIAAAARKTDRDPAAVRLVAVTKGFDSRVVAAARLAGLTRFGENRVQDALPKVAADPDAEWHLVGHLQSNKARAAVEAFAWIDSVDSLELLERVDRLAAAAGRRPTVLLQVNLTAAATQHGFDRGRGPMAEGPGGGLAMALGRLRAARVVGLMGIGPLANNPDASHSAFAGLRRLRDRLEQATGIGLPELSMGMSGDVEAAVAEGATLVRVGTALFGPRPGDR